MSQIKELLTKEMQDLLSAETQLMEALPKQAEAANHPKLKEAFQKHLAQTEGQAERLRMGMSMLQIDAGSEHCEAMAGLIREGEKTVERGADMDPIAADLALIASAQRVEHYEIASYGTARSLARQMGAFDCAKLLSQSLGEEESTDFLLTLISDPLVQQLTLTDAGADVNLDKGEKVQVQGRKSSQRKRDAA
jgi:Mn-containing catalase